MEHGWTTLTIRQVPPQQKEQLRIRAARNGRSMESELRHILGAALASDERPEPSLAEPIRRRFAPLGGLEIGPREDGSPRIVSFE